MTNDNVPTSPPSGYCSYIRAMPDDQLTWLVTASRFASRILEHAIFCGECGRRVELLTDHLWSELRAQEQEKFKEWPKEFSSQERSLSRWIDGRTAKQAPWTRCTVLLKEIARTLYDPVPVLGPKSQDTDVRTIRLASAFKTDDATLREKLPWLGETVDIVRTFTDPGGRPVYSVYASPRAESVWDNSDCCLVIVLKGANDENAIASLDASQMEAVFEGSQLLSDPDLILADFVIEKRVAIP